MLVYNLSKVEQMTDRELYKYCQDVGAKAREWKKQFVALIPEVAKRNLHRKYGFASIVDFAGRLGGVGEYTVEAVLRVQKYIADKPALLKALPKVGVHKIRLIATIATKENQEFLAKKTEEMSKSALEVWAREIRPGTEISKGIMAGKGLAEGQTQLFGRSVELESFSNMSSVDERIHYSFDVDKNTDFQLRKCKLEMEKAIKRYATWCEVMQKLIEEQDSENNNNNNVKQSSDTVTAKQIRDTETAKQITNKPRSVRQTHNAQTSRQITDQSVPARQTHNAKIGKQITRHIPAAIKREIKSKYQGKCGYPGCNRPAEEMHHTKRFAIQPNHENIVPLCKNHHEVTHTGWIKNEIDSPEKWLAGVYSQISADGPHEPHESGLNILNNTMKEKIDQKVRLYSSYLHHTRRSNFINSS